jgi:phosphoglycolate phosphatase-like HAD superfamily hydrolase
MKPPLIMLDLDGTLLDTSALYFIGIPPIIEKHLGRRVGKKDLLPLWGQLARNFFVHFARLEGVTDEARIERMYAEFSVFSNAEHNRLSRAYPGVPEKLPLIKAAGYIMGVVTTRPSARSRPVYQWPWIQILDFIIWGDQVRRNKPAPDGIDLAMQRFHPDAKTGIYVGDNPHDVLAARASHYPIRSVAALWGTMDREALLAAQPDLAFETFTDFADWLIAQPASSSKGIEL